MSSQTASKQIVRRWGAGTGAVVRLLVAARTPLTGVAIAEAVGLTQPRVSQVLSQLAKAEAVSATEFGYVGAPEVLLELYHARTRPRLVEPESYWHASTGLMEQAQQLLRVAMHHNTKLAFSADLGVELLSPQKEPVQTVIYLNKVLPIHDAGFTAVATRAEATAIVRPTDDLSLFVPAAPWRQEILGLPLTDPCQQWVDLLDLGGNDRLGAAEQFRSAIIAKTLPQET